MSALLTVDEEKFWTKVEPSGFCWQWVGPGGRYGNTYVPATRSTAPARRVAYALLVGPIPDGLTIDHLCRNTRCVNPDHMELVPLSENVKRRYGPTQTGVCRRGQHVFAGENVGISHRGGRFCRECRRQRQRDRRALAKEQAS